jgi:hypothetical protein
MLRSGFNGTPDAVRDRYLAFSAAIEQNAVVASQRTWFVHARARGLYAIAAGVFAVLAGATIGLIVWRTRSTWLPTTIAGAFALLYVTLVRDFVARSRSWRDERNGVDELDYA